jgi:acyl transferase domain-containing protein
LCSLLALNAPTAEVIAIPTLRQRGSPAWEGVLEAVGVLWGCGVEVQWGSLCKEERPRRVQLPTYPFEGIPFWYQEPTKAAVEDRPEGEAERRNRAHANRNLNRDQLISALTRIWRELLGLPEIGLEEDFFRLGGTSLMAVQLSVRIRQELERNLSLKEILEVPTVSGLTMRLLVDDDSGSATAQKRSAEAGDREPSMATSLGSRGMDAGKAQSLLENLEQLSEADMERIFCDLPEREQRE